MIRHNIYKNEVFINIQDFKNLVNRCDIPVDLIKAVSDCNGERVFPNYKSNHKSFAGAIKRDNTPMPDGMKEFLEYKRCNLITL